jgi:carboxyl-terminal processing protease
LFDKNKITITDSLKYKTKKGRVVYGGGGIIPDVFVPIEVAQGEENIEELFFQSGVISNFVFEQLDAKRDKLRTMNFQDFKTKFKNENFVPAFEKYLKKVTFDITNLKSKTIINRYIVAEFARQLYSDATYFQLLLNEDKMINEVLKKQ